MRMIISTSYSSYNGDYRVFLYFNGYTCTSIFGVNLSRNFTVMSNYMYPGRCSGKKQLDFIDYNNKSYNTIQCWGNPDLSKEPGELNNLTFYVVKDNITIGARYYIGFAFRFEDEKYSIVHQMYNNDSHIKNLLFLLIEDTIMKMELCSMEESQMNL